MREFLKRVSGKISKLTPEQVETLIDSLTEENEALNAVLDSVHTGLLICNEQWHLESKNKAASRYIPMSHFNRQTPVWEQIKNMQVADFLRKNSTIQKNHITDEFLLYDENGINRFITVGIYTLVRSKKLWGYIIQIDDITDKRKQDMIIRRMESMAGLTNLAASVAHEIKNPLGAISIHIQLIQKALKKAREGDGKLPNEKHAEKYLNVVNEEIERLNNIIVDFLSAVRPVRATIEAVDPAKMLTSFISFIEPELKEKNIELKTDFITFAPIIHIDPKLFIQVLTNLAQNAIAAMPNGGVIQISTAVVNDRFMLTFSDSGIGMNKETLDRAFEPYFTTKAQGTGLGLALVYKIIKEMAGDISIKSEEGNGSDFIITLPILQREQHLLEYANI